MKTVPSAKRLLIGWILAALAGLGLCRQAAAQMEARGPDAQYPAPGQLPWWAHDLFDATRFTDGASNHYLAIRPAARPADLFAYYPPVPPPLDSELPLLAPIVSGPPAPPMLAPLVDELFYPLLATRLAANDVSDSMLAQIAAYRLRKGALQNALRSSIADLKDLDSSARQRRLASLATDQASSIAEIEGAAEKIRANLLGTSGFSLPPESRGAVDPMARPVRGEAQTGAADPRSQSETIRGIAYYLDGLSAAQRWLLLEETVNLRASARDFETGATSQPGEVLQFSPEPAAIRIPAHLPASAREKMRNYRLAKTTLIQELREVLFETEGTPAATREEAFARLAAAQGSRLAELELKAEEIRRDLAGLPDQPGPPAPPALPPELSARIVLYQRHKLELLQTLRAMLTDSAGAPARPPATDLAPNVLAWMRDGAPQAQVQPGNLRVSVEEFNRRQDALMTVLNREQSGIREALAEYVRSAKGPSDQKSVNDLLRDFEDARQKQEMWDKFRDYQTAVLMVGLSPGQRRLLFGAAVERLALPLPPGEKIR
jgi:hypothetical protein